LIVISIPIRYTLFSLFNLSLTGYLHHHRKQCQKYRDKEKLLYVFIYYFLSTVIITAPHAGTETRMPLAVTAERALSVL
jgi:hypothetical protein